VELPGRQPGVPAASKTQDRQIPGQLLLHQTKIARPQHHPAESAAAECPLCEITHKRHTAAVHLLEAGVEVDVIRGWLGHADLTTTNRYAEIKTEAKIEALRNTEPPGPSGERRPHPVCRSDQSLLN